MSGLRKPDSVIALVVLLCAAAYLKQASSYSYGSSSGVGEGFLPFWLGIALALCALLLLFKSASSVAPVSAATELAAGRSAHTRRALLLMCGVVAVLPAMDRLGMVASIFLFTALSARLLESSWRAAAATAMVLTVVVYLLFQQWLGVPLPAGPLGF